MRVLFTIFLVIITSQFIFAAPGDLDLTFGTGGKTTANFLLPIQEATSIAIQTDGKIVVGGYVDNGAPQTDFALARFNVDGTLDTTFDGDGKVITNFGNQFWDFINDITIQPDGKIVAVGRSRFVFGNSDWALARYNTDGSLDTTFNSNGLIRIAFGTRSEIAREVVIQSDGKIVVTGEYARGNSTIVGEFLTARFNSDGSLDTTFGTNGWVTTNLTTVGVDLSTAMEIQTDGKIVVVGRYNANTASAGSAVVRYNTDGTLDTSFDTDGIAIIPNFNNLVKSIAIQSDGKYVLAGTQGTGSAADFAVARLNANGSLDTTFDVDGKLTTDISSSGDQGTTVAVQADGKIFVSGWTGSFPSDFGVVRYNPDGSLDNAFSGSAKSLWGMGGIARVDFSNGNETGGAMALDAFERVIVVGGQGVFKVTRMQNALAPTAADATITGRVIAPNGRAIPRATVYLTTQDGESITSRTNQFGYFKFEDVEVGQTLVMNVFSKRYQFQTQVINFDDSINGLEIVADK